MAFVVHSKRTAHPGRGSYLALVLSIALCALAGCRVVPEDPTPLEITVGRGDLDGTRKLLEAGADPNRGHLVLPLTLAAGEDNLVLVQLLLSHGADPNRSDHDGWGPIFSAARSGRMESVMALMSAGADVCRTTRASFARGLSPEQVAVRAGNDTAVVSMLRRAEAVCPI